ncbi:MAG: phosphate signaling complex protein PhoU [Clostridiales bacterium]|nr:phosphate signaling complex protein PhoU [Clostridiales bacterium]
MARPILEAELKDIGEGVIAMGALVESTISTAIRTLKERDPDAARALIIEDERIDDMEDEINELCLRFLATQQPVAGDLRYVISIMKIIRDLERIGDHCEDIAKYTLRFEKEECFKELIDIQRMADMASRMVKNAIDAFVHRDLRLARKVWKADEEVDEIFRDLHDELLEFAEKDSKNAKQCIMLLFIAAHLERIADYATNICEEAVFVMEGAIEME